MPTTKPVHRILLLRPSALGDVCRTVPVLASLRHTWQEAEIFWVVQSEFAAAIEAHPALTGVIPFPREEFRGMWTRPSACSAFGRWIRELRRGRWDLAIDCQGLARTGLMLAASGARLRVGDRSAREGAWLGANRRVRVTPDCHEVDRMLALAEAAGAVIDPDPTLYVPSAASAWWRDEAAKREGAFTVLATTSRWSSKAWPTDAWVELGTRLVERGSTKWIGLLGSPGEMELVSQVAESLDARGIPCVDWSGRTNVAQMMAIIEAAALTVSNDSAALHMAVGLGGRYVGLFGPTDPARVGPWRKPECAIRAPLEPDEAPSYRDAALGDRIMSRLSVDAVEKVIERTCEELAP